MKLKKIVYLISDVEKALAFEWVANYLVNRFDCLFILIGKKSTELSQYFESHQIRYIIISDIEYPSMIKKWIKLLFILRRERPDIIHAHLWRATLLGISASWLLRIKKKIFTRHHAMLHHREFPSGLKLDKLCSRLATDVVAISLNVKNIMIQMEGANASKIHIVHHGFDIPYFDAIDEDRVNRLRKKYSIPTKGPVVGVISRYLELKGIQYIIPAFIKLKKNFPDACLILANAHGNYNKEVQEQLMKIPGNSYIEIDFEEDLSALYKLFDVFVHVPVDPYAEAFGQTYVEALLSGIPSVFTLSGVAPEFIKDNHNALVVPFRNSEAIESSISRILSDNKLKENIIHNGRKSTSMFSLQGMLAKLEALYV